MSTPLISVVVPTYERPSMVVELVQSFLAQNYADKELIIRDDSKTSSVEDAVKAMNCPDSVNYIRNQTNLGYSENLKQCLLSATGDFVVVLGDDDLFAVDTALTSYVSTFERFPDAVFAYGNLVQLSAELEQVYSYAPFSQTTYFSAGRSALEGIWYKSILITGMGFRKSAVDFKSYPAPGLLFPQVKFVGELMANAAGVGIDEFLCAARAHSDQLGFRAIRGERIKDGEQHGNVEISEILDSLESRFPSARAARKNLEKQLTSAYTTNMPNEKAAGGNRLLITNLRSLTSRNRVARRSPALYLVFLVCLLLPIPVLTAAKNLVRKIVNSRKNTANETSSFPLIDQIKSGNVQTSVPHGAF